ncbi:hypothetical protein KP509_1Z328100 [Ceratopteris richardii]|nr:hypothetical protein KP509_1Z328100 [Ceratopteris richardii]
MKVELLHVIMGEDQVDFKAKQVVLVVPHSVCGAIIGKGGATIRSFVEESHANIKLSPSDQNIRGLHDRLVSITGSFDQQMHAVALITKRYLRIQIMLNMPLLLFYTQAKICWGCSTMLVHIPVILSLVTELLPSGHSVQTMVCLKRYLNQMGPFLGARAPLPFPVISSNTANTSIMIAIPDERIGVIVGRGGKTIYDIEQLSGSRIRISDRGDFVPGTTDRKVMITGSPDCIYLAHQILSQKIHQI